jgi:hypothetical protein
MKKLVIGIAAVGVTVAGVRLSASTDSPQTPQTTPPPALPAPGSTAEAASRVAPGKFEVSPVLEGGAVNVVANHATVLDLLRAIGAKAGYKMLISDDAETEKRNHRITLNYEKVSPDMAIRLISSGSYSLGRIGKDTFLIVRAPTTPRLVLDSRRVLTPRAPEAAPPPGKPFEFNGHKYYLVPLSPEEAAASTQQAPAPNTGLQKAR